MTSARSVAQDWTLRTAATAGVEGVKGRQLLVQFLLAFGATVLTDITLYTDACVAPNGIFLTTSSARL